MTATIKHSFVSTIPDSTNTALVRPSNWNADHVLDGVIGISNGGTNSTDTPTAGGVSYGDGTQFKFTTAGTTGQILQSNGTDAPSWVDFSGLGVSSFSADSTGLTPATPTTGAVTLGGILNIEHGGTNGTAAPTAGAVAYGDGTSYAFTSVGTSNQVLISNGSSSPSWASGHSVTQLAIVNDPDGDVTYNLAMTTASGGYINTEYVDANDLTYHPSYGNGSTGVGALSTPSAKVRGYFTLTDPTENKPAAFECYSTGTVTLYTTQDTEGDTENICFSNKGWMTIGCEIDNYVSYAPLYIREASGAQLIINNNLANSDGLHVTYSGTANFTNTTNNSMEFGTNDTLRMTINGSGALGFGTSPSYGTNGQVLASQGNGTVPHWVDGSSIGGNITITNDDTSNTNYNLTFTTASSGTITGEFVDNAKLYYNPSEQRLFAPNLTLLVPNNGESYLNFKDTTTGINQSQINVYSNFGGSGRGYFEIYVYDGTSEQGNNLNFNGYGAFGFDDNFGSAGQVLISAGSTGKTYWGNASSVGGAINISDDTTTNDVRYPLYANATSGLVSTEYVSSTKYQYNPYWGEISSTSYKGDFVDIRTTPTSTVTYGIGRLWWSPTGTLNIGMGNGNITQQVGEEIFIYGKASSAITEGQVVVKTGAVGASGVITFAPAGAGITDDQTIIGLATENIALNGFGRITAFGVVHGIDTSAFSDGDIVWYDPATGGLTATKPTAPNVKCEIGIVINAGSGGSGSIQVEIIHGTSLGGTDSNVNITSVADNDLLQYDSSLSYWKNVPSTSVNAALNIVDDTTTNSDFYPTFTSATSGLISEERVSSTHFSYNPSTGSITTYGDAFFNGMRVGHGAANVTSNSVVGADSLSVATGGANNTAMGYQSLKNVTSGSNLTGFGYQAGYSATTAAEFNVFGYQAGYSNTTGHGLTAVGYQAGYANVTGDYNTYLGSHVGTAATSSYNTIVGGLAFYLNTTGEHNTGIGMQCLYQNNGSNNIAIGFKAGYYETTAANSFYLDSLDRGTLADGKTGAMFYGTFDATPSNQTLAINAKVTIPYELRINSTLSLNGSTGTSGYVLTSNGASAPTWQALPATGVTISDDTTTNATRYPLFANQTSGSATTEYVSSTKYTYNPSTGDLSAPAVASSNGITVNSATVSASYSIPSGSNGLSAGPVTVASGVAVTVPTGSTWVIV